jgi:hypothetical protein
MQWGYHNGNFVFFGGSKGCVIDSANSEDSFNAAVGYNKNISRKATALWQIDLSQPPIYVSAVRLFRQAGWLNKKKRTLL